MLRVGPYSSLPRSTSPVQNHGQDHCMQLGCGHWRIRAAARNGYNDVCSLDKYSRRPEYGSRNFSFMKSRRQPRTLQQTPKLKRPRPKGFYFFLLGGFETRQQYSFEKDLKDQYLSKCQHHECSLLEPLLTGNWTSDWYGTNIQPDSIRKQAVILERGREATHSNMNGGWIHDATMLAGSHRLQASVALRMTCENKITLTKLLEPRSTAPWVRRAAVAYVPCGRLQFYLLSYACIMCVMLSFNKSLPLFLFCLGVKANEISIVFFCHRFNSQLVVL